jgi:uncharacterized protein YprB with RNaseH-like and TPR domain
MEKNFSELINKINKETEIKNWKFYVDFPCFTLFLDIETEGLCKEKNDITLIGIYANKNYYPFIKGFNLERVIKWLESYPIWVTFGGNNFDIPFIKKKFPYLKNPLVHIDLYFLAKEVGLRGGLKKIERTLGISRQTEGLNGYDAVKLWNRWLNQKDKKALQKLILYNKEDVINLKKILDYLVERFSEMEK